MWKLRLSDIKYLVQGCTVSRKAGFQLRSVVVPVYHGNLGLVRADGGRLRRQSLTDSCKSGHGEGQWDRLCINSRPVFIPTHGVNQASSSIWHNLRALNANPAPCHTNPSPAHPWEMKYLFESLFLRSEHLTPEDPCKNT